MAIFLLGPDPQGNCCDCANRQNPCDSCVSCTGIYYNTQSGQFGPFSNSLGGLCFPPSDCYVAKQASDSYAKTSSSIQLNISSQNIGPRTNAFSVSLNPNDVLTINLQTSSTSTSSQLASWLQANSSGFYGLFIPNVSGYYISLINETGVGATNWAKILTSNLGGLFTVNAQINSSQIQSSDSSINLYDNNLLNNIRIYQGNYHHPYSYTTGNDPLGTSPLKNGYNDYNLPVCVRYVYNTHWPSDEIAGGATIISDSSYLTPSGVLFDYAGYAKSTLDLPSYTICFRCLYGLGGWTPISATQNPIFGRNVGDQAYITQLVTNNEPTINSLSNGNIGYCIISTNIADDPANQTALIDDRSASLNGFTCNKDSDSSNPIQCVGVHQRLEYFYSTSWPSRNPPSASQSRNLSLQILEPICADISVGNGGLITGNGFTYAKQAITGYWGESATASIDVNRAFSLNPILFYTGALSSTNRVTCPINPLP